MPAAGAAASSHRLSLVIWNARVAGPQTASPAWSQAGCGGPGCACFSVCGARGQERPRGPGAPEQRRLAGADLKQVWRSKVREDGGGLLCPRAGRGLTAAGGVASRVQRGLVATTRVRISLLGNDVIRISNRRSPTEMGTQTAAWRQVKGRGLGGGHPAPGVQGDASVLPVNS